MKTHLKIAVISVLVSFLIVPLVPSHAQTVSISTLESEIAKKVNEYRTSNSMDRLSYDARIADVARSHSEQLKRYDVFQHETPGTNRDSITRGYVAGYGICGSQDAIDRFYTINEVINEYQNKLNEYERNVQILNQFRQNDQAFANKVTVDGRWLQNTYNQLNNVLLPQFYDDVNNYMIGIGFVENIALINLTGNDTIKEIRDFTVQSWIDSPDHNEVMLSNVHSIGVGIAETKDSKLLITLNMC